MITKLSHATIYVLDQDEALRFYTEKLGFEVRTDVKMGDFRWLTVGAKGQPDLEIILYAVKGHGGMMDEETISHLRAILDKGLMGPGAFDTDDCRAAYEELKSKGVEFVSPPQEQPYGIEAIFKDGCGNWFSLTQHS
jgi:catechol 2,3-dioxygenase-like lactoylglutathione lyase family enzyme